MSCRDVFCENQLRDLDPPETKQTYERLIAEGFSDEEARRLIGSVVATEIFYLLRDEKPFDLKKYTRALSHLPGLPDDE